MDFGSRTLRVRRNLPAGRAGETAPKSGKVRSVPLADRVAAALDGLSLREHFTAPEDRVFPGATGGPLDDKLMRQRFYDALDSSGLGHLRDPDRIGGAVTFHDLRHSFGTLAVQAFSLTDVRAMMGHAGIQTTMRYVHYAPQHNAADQLTRLVSRATGGPVGGTTEAHRPRDRSPFKEVSPIAKPFVGPAPVAQPDRARDF